MNKLILEIGTEEIPSEYIDDTLINLNNIAKKELQSLHIDYEEIQTFGTPRRIILYVEGIHSKQKDIFKKIKGPSRINAFDPDGNPRKPAIKFAQSNQVKVEDLVTKKIDKGEYVFANKVKKGKDTEILLPEFFITIINSLNFPKSMRWGRTFIRFIRPIRWILALYNEKIIPCKLGTIYSSNISFGHRLLSPDSFKINSANDYFKAMKNNYVIIDPKERKMMIKNEIERIIQENNWVDPDENKLLDEVKNLVEYPRVLLGKFDSSYLELPQKVLKAVMINHQKYFPIYNKKKELLPNFFVVINGNQDKFHDGIILGNERVLKARLEDARFFYLEDQKTDNINKKPLDSKVEKLKSVVYQENLGTIYDKVNRLVALSEKIGKDLKLKQNLLDIIKRSAELCKADLVSEMVKEFPELQGIIGKEYALLQGEDSQIAMTIFEHYLPRFSEDNLPTTISGSILSIADKIDNIVSCFINRNIPDGSQDPYALRRQSLGIINIIMLYNLNINIKEIIDFNIKLIKENENLLDGKKIDDKTINRQIKIFILQRFRNLLLEKGYRYDVIDAVLVKEPDNIIDTLLKIKELQQIYHLKKFSKIITAATRTFNLSKNTSDDNVNPLHFKEEEEKNLFDEYLKAKKIIEEAISEQQYGKVFNCLEEFSIYVDIFFDNVLVMEKDDLIRRNRLALLKLITDLFHRIADLSKIALSKGKNN